MSKVFYLKCFTYSKKDAEESDHLNGQISEQTMLGPYKKNQILKKIVYKKTTPQSFLYSKEDKKWIPIFQREEFKNYFPKNDEEKTKSWTLLKKNLRASDEDSSNQTNGFVSTGPYLRDGLQMLLCKGIVSDQDFVWSLGLASWERISLCPAFHTPLGAKIEDMMDVLSIDYKKIKNTDVSVTYKKRENSEPCSLSDDKLQWRK